MAYDKFINAINTQQYLIAKILRTTCGGWICAIGDTEVFLPGSQLYKNIEDYEAYVGMSVKVMVQRADERSIVVSHKDYVSKIFELKDVIANLEIGQKLYGIIKGETDRGYKINVMGIIGFMRKEDMCDSNNYAINSHIECYVRKADAENLILLLCKNQENAALEVQEKEEGVRRAFISKLKINEVLNGVVKKAVPSGFLVEFSNGIIALLRSKEIPRSRTIIEGDSLDVAVSEIDLERGLFFVSLTKLAIIKWEQIFKFVKDNIVPEQTVLTGRVVYLERDLVTLRIKHLGQDIYGYIKKDDLAWEKVQNAADVVFLDEEIRVKYLYEENRKLYFDLKWQQNDIYPQELFNLDIDGILAFMNVQKNCFAAKVSLLYGKNPRTGEDGVLGALATNFVALGDEDKNIQLIDRYTGVNITAFIPSKYAYGLEDGNFYKFKLDVAPSKKRIAEHRPYMFTAQLEGGAIPIDNPYRSLVEKSFKENKTPKSNRDLAKNLKEFGADMYSDRDRMFYELLQNADDASSQKGVKVMIQVKNDYLIFTHDGLSFSRQDFRSIVSTANSTKRLDRKKTGYKGIGFKSVFTDSKKVYIRTGGFFFVFDKEAELFRDFRQFYKYVNPLYTEEQLRLFFEDNIEYEEEFEQVDHLPWQILPFWVENCPKELRGTTFQRNCNVAIALELESTAEKYRGMIKGIIQKPRFMLFLRNTQRIQLEEPIENENSTQRWNIISIAKQVDDANNVVRLKNSFGNVEEEVSYIVREGNNVSVDNDAFAECEIPLYKVCQVVADRDKWSLYHVTAEHNILITSIPERIVAADTTNLSYAFMLDKSGCVMAIPDKTPSLYAFLPMEDRRYLFPFFINADFELSSNRQEANKVSVWNEYLFYNIGKNVVSWVASVASTPPFV